MKANIVTAVISAIISAIIVILVFKGGCFKENRVIEFRPVQQGIEKPAYFSQQQDIPEPEKIIVHPQPPAPASSNNYNRLPNGIIYSDYLTSGTGDSYCAQFGLVCTNLVSCQLEKGGCNPSEYCTDTRTPGCPCTARCAPTKEMQDDAGQCGYCRWVDIECSLNGGIWTGTEVPCDPQHAGVIVMKHHKNDCGPQHLEAYTEEQWGSCFTPRAQCVCN